MPACCVPDGYAQLFDEKNARSDARNYLEKGLDPTGQRLVDEILRRGVAGPCLVGFGGGMGARESGVLRAGGAGGPTAGPGRTWEQPARERENNPGPAVG